MERFISGPGCNNVEVFVRPFLDELRSSFEGGFEAYDGLRKEWALSRMACVVALFDTRGLAKITVLYALCRNEGIVTSEEQPTHTGRKPASFKSCVPPLLVQGVLVPRCENYDLSSSF